jgi:hypothetical protein
MPEQSNSTVYHVVNPKLFKWTDELLPALASSGIKFKTVSQRDWVRLLRESDQDPTKNPAVKLTAFFAEKYDNDLPGRKGLVFKTEISEKASEALKGAPNVVNSGLMEKFVQKWMEKWVEKESRDW